MRFDWNWLDGTLIFSPFEHDLWTVCTYVADFYWSLIHFLEHHICEMQGANYNATSEIKHDRALLFGSVNYGIENMALI